MSFGTRSLRDDHLDLIGYDYYAMWSQKNCAVSKQSTQSNSQHPIVAHNCRGTPGMSGSPLTGRTEQNSPNNDLLPVESSSDVIYGMHTHVHRRRHGRALKFNLCIYHTICGWLNYEENSSDRDDSIRSEPFIRSLGTTCASMTNFVPSLIRRLWRKNSKLSKFLNILGEFSTKWRESENYWIMTPRLIIIEILSGLQIEFRLCYFYYVVWNYFWREI